MTVNRFEDLVAWRKGRTLVRLIYIVTSSRSFRQDVDLARQIRRAAISVPSNIAEGFDRARRCEFHNYLVIAKGSCAEVRSQLYIALDVGHLRQADFRRIYRLVTEVGRFVGSLRAAVDKQSRESQDSVPVAVDYGERKRVWTLAAKTSSPVTCAPAPIRWPS